MRKPFARTLVAGCVHCGWQRACAAARWRVYGAGVGTARRASGLLALAAPPINPQKRLRSLAPSSAGAIAAREAKAARRRGWVTAAASRVTRRPTWRAGAACRSCRVAVACVPCRLPTWRVGCCYSTWGARADPRVAAGGCLSPSLRARRAACGVTVASQPPLGGPRTPSGTSSARASRRSGEAVALRVLVSTLLVRQPAAPPY